jgi:hypothetical protein
LPCVFFQSLDPLTSAFTVLEDEVKRSEMWKLTCQECKVNAIRAGKRKQKKKKKSNNEERTDYTGVLLLTSKIWNCYLKMSSTRTIKTCQKCKTSAGFPYLLLKIAL